MRHYLTNEQTKARSRKIEIADNEDFKLDKIYIYLKDSIRLGNPSRIAKYFGRALANVHKARKQLRSEYDYINLLYRRPE